MPKFQNIINRVYYSFPVQLIILLFKKNLLLLLYWFCLFGCVTQGLANKYGIPFLFLDPEYLGNVGYTAFFIMGVACGGFIMAFTLASYMLNSFRFPFLATLSRPFLKYFINNSIVPLAFLLTYIYCFVSFQLSSEFQSGMTVLLEVIMFLSGVFLISFLTITYYFSTNKDIFKMTGIKSEAEFSIPKIQVTQRISMTKDMKWETFKKSNKREKEWRVDVYLSTPFKIRLVRGTEHYSEEMLMSVFKQNHLNAAIMEIALFIMIIVLGLFRNNSLFRIPAGASIMIFFTMLLMLTSSFRFWIRGWWSTIVILTFLVLNFFSQFEFFTQRNQAFGLDYKNKLTQYNLDTLKYLSGNTNYSNDILNTISILEKWKEKAPLFISHEQGKIKVAVKPKIIFINTSGGGLRAAVWTFRTLQVADSALNGNLFDYTRLITGASGGVVGASYFRELVLQHKLGKINNHHDNIYSDNISKDILNPIALSIIVNDMFLSFQKFDDGKYTYKKDRGYEFEKQLNENTGYLLNKRLLDYREPESDAIIPMMVFNPTIVNDGRRLFISAQPVSYLLNRSPNDNLTTFNPVVEGVEFTRFFKKQNAWNIKFTSVLRMSATFPYIMPTVSLPCEPPMEVLDAGMRDNFGLQASLRFLYTFRKWINNNTSGVIFIQIRDTHKELPVEDNTIRTLFQNMTTPIGNFYANFARVQDYNQDELMQYASSWFNGKMDVISFQLPNEKQNISLSWHLTTREKKHIYNAINLPENQAALNRLKSLFNE